MTKAITPGFKVVHPRLGPGVVVDIIGDRVAIKYLLDGSIHTCFVSDIKINDKKRDEAQAQDGERSGPAPLQIFRASIFAGKSAPPRGFHVPGLIPERTVTLLSGDGGTGKSLVTLMLGASTVANRQWLGRDVKQGPVIYLSAEDEADEMHRRLEDIALAFGISMADLNDLHIIALAGEDAVLAASGRSKNVIVATPLWQQVEKAIHDIDPRLVVWDTSADIYAGDESVRPQVRQFVSMLRGLAIKRNHASLLLSHPSLTGLSSGSGTSGSTAWNNSVRSRLYFERVFSTAEKVMVEADPDVRVLTNKKANYGPTGETIRVRWVDGVFEVQESPGAGTAADRNAAAEAVFLKLLQMFEQQGRDVSAKPSSTFAPKVFAEHPDNSGITRRAFQFAMERLLASKRIRIEEVGPASKRRSRLTAYQSTAQEEAA